MTRPSHLRPRPKATANVCAKAGPIDWSCCFEGPAARVATNSDGPFRATIRLTTPRGSRS
eukprot:353666-Chlamydomonas_euryale.AAC.5